MRFKSEEQRKAVMAKIRLGRRLGSRHSRHSQPLRFSKPAHPARGKTYLMTDPGKSLRTADGLLKAAIRSEKAGDIPEATFRSAYPAAEKTIKAASPDYRKEHDLSGPLRRLAQGRFGPAYLQLGGTSKDNAAKITPELIHLAEEVEKLWPPYENHIEITEQERDKTLRLAIEVNKILQPKPEAKT